MRVAHPALQHPGHVHLSQHLTVQGTATFAQGRRLRRECADSGRHGVQAPGQALGVQRLGTDEQGQRVGRRPGVDRLGGDADHPKLRQRLDVGLDVGGLAPQGLGDHLERLARQREEVPVQLLDRGREAEEGQEATVAHHGLAS
ncbi:MAG: hypothetical protein R2734_13910 [Nocardioides sp.]